MSGQPMVVNGAPSDGAMLSWFTRSHVGMNRLARGWYDDLGCYSAQSFR